MNGQRPSGRPRPPLSPFDRSAMAVVRYARVRHRSRRPTGATYTAASTLLGALAALGAVVAGVMAGWALITRGAGPAVGIVTAYLVALAVTAGPVLALVGRLRR